MPFLCFESFNGCYCLKNRFQILQCSSKVFHNYPLEILSTLLSYTSVHILGWVSSLQNLSLNIPFLYICWYYFFCQKWCFRIFPFKNYFFYQEITSRFKDRNKFWSLLWTTVHNINKWNVYLIKLDLRPNA